MFFRWKKELLGEIVQCLTPYTFSKTELESQRQSIVFTIDVFIRELHEYWTLMEIVTNIVEETKDLLNHVPSWSSLICYGQMRTARVIPRFKSCDFPLFTNNRPVSAVSVFFYCSSVAWSQWSRIKNPGLDHPKRMHPYSIKNCLYSFD